MANVKYKVRYDSFVDYSFDDGSRVIMYNDGNVRCISPDSNKLYWVNDSCECTPVTGYYMLRTKSRLIDDVMETYAHYEPVVEALMNVKVLFGLKSQVVYTDD